MAASPSSDRRSSRVDAQPESFSTTLITEASSCRWRRRTSRAVSLHGSDPVNSGGGALLDPLAGLRSHFADLADCDFLRVELERRSCPSGHPAAGRRARGRRGVERRAGLSSIWPADLTATLLPAPPTSSGQDSRAMGLSWQRHRMHVCVSPSLAGSRGGRARRSPSPPSGSPGRDSVRSSGLG